MRDPVRVGQVFDARVSISLSGALLVLAFVVMGAYCLWPSSRDHLEFSTKILGGATAIYGAYYVGTTLHLRLQREKQDKTFEILNTLNRPEFVSVRRFIAHQISDPKAISPNELYKAIVDDSNLLQAVTVVLGVYEDAAIAIQCDYIDERILHQSLAFLIPWTFNMLKPYILETRRIDGYPDLYIETERLTSAWTAKKWLYGDAPMSGAASA